MAADLIKYSFDVVIKFTYGTGHLTKNASESATHCSTHLKARVTLQTELFVKLYSESAWCNNSKVG